VLVMTFEVSTVQQVDDDSNCCDNSETDEKCYSDINSNVDPFARIDTFLGGNSTRQVTEYQAADDTARRTVTHSSGSCEHIFSCESSASTHAREYWSL
jgi:hypothetical protein